MIITNHDSERKNIPPIIVLVSETVEGINSMKISHIPNNYNYTLQFLGAVLTNPSNGNIDNFLYSKLWESIISINHDEAFENELRIEENDTKSKAF